MRNELTITRNRDIWRICGNLSDCFSSMPPKMSTYGLSPYYADYQCCSTNTSRLFSIQLQVSGMTALLIYIIILLIIFIIASFWEFHKLRITRLKELYEYVPEVKREKIFRIFYKLYQEGEFKKDTRQRQQWDEDVFEEMQKNCNEFCRNNYLTSTWRQWGNFSLLKDDQYDLAMKYIKNMLDNNLDYCLK